MVLSCMLTHKFDFGRLLFETHNAHQTLTLQFLDKTNYVSTIVSVRKDEELNASHIWNESTRRKS